MTENILQDTITETTQKVRNRPRFSVSSYRSNQRQPRRLSTRLMTDDIDESTEHNTSDTEWLNFMESLRIEERKFKEIENEIGDVLDMDSETEHVRALTFSSPDKMNAKLEKISKQREELELVRKSIQIDYELEELTDYVKLMEENFKNMFLQVTQRRIAKQLNHKEIEQMDLHDILDHVNLDNHSYKELAPLIEEAIYNTVK